MTRRFKGFKKVDAGEAELAHRKGQEVLCQDAYTRELYLLKSCNPNFIPNLFAQQSNLFYITEVEKGAFDE